MRYGLAKGPSSQLQESTEAFESSSSRKWSQALEPWMNQGNAKQGNQTKSVGKWQIETFPLLLLHGCSAAHQLEDVLRFKEFKRIHSQACSKEFHLVCTEKNNSFDHSSVLPDKFTISFTTFATATGNDADVRGWQLCKGSLQSASRLTGEIA